MHAHRRHRQRLLVCSSAAGAPRTTANAAPVPTAADTQLASTTAGLLSRAVLHPVDSVKTRLQHLRGRSDVARPMAALMGFLAQEGLPGLYRGVAGALAGVIPHSMLYMPSYEAAQLGFGRILGDRDLGGTRHLAAGALAGIAGSVVKVPVDVVKKRVQAGLHNDVWNAARSIIARAASDEAARLAARSGGGVGAVGAGVVRGGVTRARCVVAGVGGLYVGWGGAMMYGVPYNAIQFFVLERVRGAARRLAARRRRALTAVDNVLVGAVTGMITSVATEPLDVVKTRLMTQRAPGAAGKAGETLYRGWAHCVRTMVREEGATALWKGTLPRLVWVGASSALWYGTYQTTRQAFARRREERRARAAAALLDGGDGDGDGVGK